jgi:hypothetical protein
MNCGDDAGRKAFRRPAWGVSFGYAEGSSRVRRYGAVMAVVGRRARPGAVAYAAFTSPQP